MHPIQGRIKLVLGRQGYTELYSAVPQIFGVFDPAQKRLHPGVEYRFGEEVLIAFFLAVRIRSGAAAAKDCSERFTVEKKPAFNMRVRDSVNEPVPVIASPILREFPSLVKPG